MLVVLLYWNQCNGHIYLVHVFEEYINRLKQPYHDTLLAIILNNHGRGALQRLYPYNSLG
jgi:hypothetical protein